MANEGMTREQKKVLGILSAGTFLEFFDLYLYVHLAVVLNDLFFPKTDPLTTQLLTALTFSSTFILRPIGGVVIGWIGDHVGRKLTIVITTLIMAVSCLTMANIGTYAEIGITASFVMVGCRMLQGFSSLGESVGAMIYIVEMFKPPLRYVCNAIISVSIGAGVLFALCIASFAVSIGLNWRIVFWVGAGIAGIGLWARTGLRETPEFADYKRRIKIKAEKSNIEINQHHIIHEEKVDKKAILAYFLLDLVFPVGLYTAYIYPTTFMRENLKFSAGQVIGQNLKVSICTTLIGAFIVYLVRKYHPLKIAQATLIFFIIFLPFIPYCFHNISSPFSLLLLQVGLVSLGKNTSGTLGTVLFKHFPVAKRFRVVAMTFGIANPLSTVIVSFSLIPLHNYFGHYGLWFILIPTTIGYFWGINYLRKLETKKGSYLNYPHEVGYTQPDTILEDHRYDDEHYLGDEYEPFRGSCEYSTQFLSGLEELNKTMDRKININAVKHGITFAKKWHHGQPRNTGEPFYTHPIAVAKLASEYYFKTDVLIAALLHDTIEDCKGCTLDLIEEKFNKRIAQMVDGLTKNQIVNGKEEILELKETLEMLHKKKDYEALFIKEMDRVHNLQTADGWKPEKQKKKVEETMQHMLPMVAYVAEKLGIHGKVHLENKVFNLCQKITAKNNKNKK